MRFIRILAALLCLAALTTAAYAAEADGEEGRYIVRLRETPKTRGFSLSAVPYAEGCYLAESPEELAPLLERGVVELVARDAALELLDAPNDPALDRQWYLDTLGMEALWDSGYDGAGVTVALVDSGVNYAHEEFAGAELSGLNCLDPVKHPEDYGDGVGHGTLVAGILAAGRDNGVGGTGLTPRASVVALRCFSSKQGNISNVLSAVGWAIENRVDVLNLSLGAPEKNLRAEEKRLMEESMRQAADAGILIVSAAGNSGETALFYPAAFDCVTGVGWTNPSDGVASASQHNESVFVTAPGSGIYGPNMGSSNAYSTKDGSSFATPMVTALAILAKQADKAIEYTGFQRLLRLCARDLGAAGWDEYYGHGLVSAAAFVEALEAPQPIVYDCGEGRITDERYPESYRIGHGAEAVLPIQVWRTGFTFAGWYPDADCEGEPLTAIPAGSVGEVAVYAKWTPDAVTMETRAYVSEDGRDYCAATIRCDETVSGAACAARYDGEGRFLGCETASLTAGEAELCIERGGAASVRFFALDGAGAPLASRADAPEPHGEIT